MWAIDCEKFVINIIKLLGNYNGTTCAHYGHAISTYLGKFVYLFDNNFKK